MLLRVLCIMWHIEHLPFLTGQEFLKYCIIHASYFSWRNLKHKGAFNLVTQIYHAQLWDYKQLS